MAARQGCKGRRALKSGANGQSVDHRDDQAEDVAAAMQVVSNIFAQNRSEHSQLVGLSQTLAV
jgi:hypothetical protein